MTVMEVDAYTSTAFFDLPIELATYLRATSRAADLQRAILSTSQHAIGKVFNNSSTGTINVNTPTVMSTDMEVDNGYYTHNTILDLPIESLTHVASYLTTPSRALFTVALALAHVDSSKNNPCTLWRQYERNALSIDTITALNGYHWDTLDFGDVEKDLASRLSDYDIHAVLIIIDAVNRLKTLRLSHCTNITGSCLEPLHGSLVLEKIDLSLVGDNKSPKIDPAQHYLPIMMSFDHVLPILDSIIERGGNRLRHIQFHHISRAIVLGKYPGSSEFRQFVTRYNDMWKKRGVIGCSKCHADINACGDTTWLHSNRWMHIFGIQFNTCYGCTRHFCDDCASKVLVDDEKGRVDTQMLAFCAHCQKYYCADCKRMERCQVGIGCDKYVCSDCNFLHECSGCSWKMCGDCFVERRGCSSSRCNEAFCDFCE